MIIIHQRILVKDVDIFNDLSKYIPGDCIDSFSRFKIGINVNNFILIETTLMEVIKLDGCLRFYLDKKLSTQKAINNKSDFVFSGSLDKKLNKYLMKFVNLIIIMDDGKDLDDSMDN